MPQLGTAAAMRTRRFHAAPVDSGTRRRTAVAARAPHAQDGTEGYATYRPLEDEPAPQPGCASSAVQKGLFKRAAQQLGCIQERRPLCGGRAVTGCATHARTTRWTRRRLLRKLRQLKSVISTAVDRWVNKRRRPFDTPRCVSQFRIEYNCFLHGANRRLLLT